MREYDNFEYAELISTPLAPDTLLIGVIPAYNEPELEKTLESLARANGLVGGRIEVIIVLNDKQDTPLKIREEHIKQFESLKKWNENNSAAPIRIEVIYISGMEGKSAGVGLARKIGMDEAVRRFLSIDLRDGVIFSLDADVEVHPNYFESIYKTFLDNPKLRAASVYFEHDLEVSFPESTIDAIVQYECHLRYYIQMQRLLKLPFAYHTVGSAMTVRVSAYMDHFGMNKRQAGEDFYFLHKFIKSGFFTEINETVVYPSARFSDRVPFGTGKTVEKLSVEKMQLKTYHFKSFEALVTLTENLPLIYSMEDFGSIDLAPEVVSFFGNELEERVGQIKKHTSNYESFQKRFFQWFDAFHLIKYLHHVRDNFHSNLEVSVAISYIMEKSLSTELVFSLKEQLIALRALQRKTEYGKELF